MDILVKEIDGKETIWYSPEYLKRQIESAYRAGLFKGIKVELHALTPMNGEMVDDLTHEFKRRLESEYRASFENSEVWRIGPK